MQSWQIISSAPADGTAMIFAIVQNGRVTMVGRCLWLAESAGQAGCWWSDDLCRAVEPTHWLPMPTLAPAQDRTDAPVARMTAEAR